jgi:hypothetical protein
MNLAQDDLKTIHEVVKDEITVTMRATIKEGFAPIHGELEALRNDVKDLFDMIAELQVNSSIDLPTNVRITGQKVKVKYNHASACR